MLANNNTTFPIMALWLLMESLVPVNADMSSLVGALTSDLGVTEAQASGGAGAIFKLAKDRLTPNEFQTVSNSLPGIDTLIDAAPALGETSGMLGGAASLMGGMGNLGSLANLVEPFSKLGMSSDMIGKFVPIILQYAKSTGGDAVMGLLKGALVAG